MLTVIKATLFSVGKQVVLAAISEAVLKRAIIALLKEGAKRTDWKTDDKIVEDIEKALK